MSYWESRRTRMPSPLSHAELVALVDWYSAVGVDVCLGDEPVDRFAETAREAEERRQRAAAVAERFAGRPAPRPDAAAAETGAPAPDRAAPDRTRMPQSPLHRWSDLARRALGAGVGLLILFLNIRTLILALR